MSDLDGKLREILTQIAPINMNDKTRNGGARAVEQIKQVFADAGYKVCTEVMGGTHGHILEDDGSSHNIRPDLKGIK